MRIVVDTKISAPIDNIWRAYTDPSHITQWNFASDDWHCPHAVGDLREGGKFSSRMEAKDGSFGFDFEGTYTKIVPQQRLEYNFGDRTAEIDFIDEQDGVTVRVTFDAETENPVELQRDGWQAILNNFRKYAEQCSV